MNTEDHSNRENPHEPNQEQPQNPSQQKRENNAPNSVISLLNFDPHLKSKRFINR